MADVCVYYLRGKVRSQKMAYAMLNGARAAGYSTTSRCDTEYDRPRDSIAAVYGFQGENPKMMRDFIKAGRPVIFCDLGYWGRRAGGRWAGYHKIAVNGRHPGDYFMARERSGARFKKFGVRVMPWRPQGHHILLAGMSGKAAESYGLGPGEWERWAIEEIRKHSKRPIVFRPKPGHPMLPGIKNAILDTSGTPQRMLHNAHCVVTHHSNVAIEGLAAGIPAFVWDGAATHMALNDLSRIESPWMPEGRQQWFHNLAWCQWNVTELSNGQMWRFLMAEGMIPGPEKVRMK